MFIDVREGTMGEKIKVGTLDNTMNNLNGKDKTELNFLSSWIVKVPNNKPLIQKILTPYIRMCV
jgi:hypothetical protein